MTDSDTITVFKRPDLFWPRLVYISLVVLITAIPLSFAIDTFVTAAQFNSIIDEPASVVTGAREVVIRTSMGISITKCKYQPALQALTGLKDQEYPTVYRLRQKFGLQAFENGQPYQVLYISKAILQSKQFKIAFILSGIFTVAMIVGAIIVIAMVARRCKSWCR